ncbi:hypothetical protein MPSEU_000734400 [Mayamaea pseudoterrestris]|nr:hypothetical protein MPSEU_000734400 [Mayamaea pseudoterrestris]
MADGPAPLPKCVCGWKNCRVYQKAFREARHPFWDGVVKIKFTKDETESTALKQSVDRILKVDPSKREEWKVVKDHEMARYNVAKHHFTEQHAKKAASEQKFSFLKPFSEHGAKKYLYSLDPRDTITNGRGDIFYLQVPNNPKEVVKAHFLQAKEDLEYQRAGKTPPSAAHISHASGSDEEEDEDDEMRTVTTERSRAEYLLSQKEQENVKLKDQLESMQDQLKFLHDMVRKLQEEHIPAEAKSVRSGAVSKARHNQSQNARPARQRRTHSGRSGRSGVPDEIELGEESNTQGEEDLSQWNGENGDWSEHYDDDENDNTTVATFRSSYHNRGDGASVVSRASRATSIVSASKSVKSLPRDIELDADEDDSESHESLENEAFDNKSMASNWRGSQHSRDDDENDNGTRQSRRSSMGQSSAQSSNTPSSGPIGKQKRRSSLANHLSKGGSSDNKSVSWDGKSNGNKVENGTDHSSSVGAGTYPVQALVVTDPYGEQGTYTGSISNATNMPHGYGRLEYDRAGRWYEGDWKHGRWTGHGRLSNGDGDYYEGGLKNDHKHGRGIMKFADGRVFEGEYINGQMIEGKMTYQDGSTYTGSWVDGMRHGKGRCVFTDHSVYEGEFREGEFYGYGKMSWSDGGWYEGNWVYGEMDGYGKEVRPDGTLRHQGEWRKGQPVRK